MTESATTRLVFRPRFFDRSCVTLLIWPGLVAFVLAFLMMSGPKPTTFHCSRSTATCDVFFPSLFGGDHYEYPLATVLATKAVQGDDGIAWQIERTKGPVELAHATKDPKLAATYTQDASQLQAFLSNPSRPTYEVSIAAPAGGPPAALFAGIGVVMCLLGLRWWRGWNAELVLDRDQHPITIRRKPMFFTGPREQTFARSNLKLAEGLEKRYIGRGQVHRFARFALRTQAGGKRVFSYATLYDRKAQAKLDGDLAALQSFFT